MKRQGVRRFQRSWHTAGNSPKCREIELVSATEERYPFRTLPDYLGPELRLVFVGINPGLYSVEHGHYFARPTNRFWPAFSRSVLSEPIRKALRRAVLGSEQDASLIQFGIGFTDVVKVPSRNVADLPPELFRIWAPRLLRRLLEHQPQVACFHGLTAVRPFVRYALNQEHAGIRLGAQLLTAGRTRLFVVPNPSPANAHVNIRDQTDWYDRLSDYLAAATKEEQVVSQNCS